MNTFRILTSFLFFLTGAFFLQGGLTAHIISESCCSGPGCTQQNTCDYAKPFLGSAGSESPVLPLTFLGLFLSALGFLSLYIPLRQSLLRE